MRQNADGQMIDFLSVERYVAALSTEKERGDAFERAVAHLLRHDPEFGIRRVWGWSDWPGREAVGAAARDLGIDLVAEDATGRLVGVQVKFRLDPDRLIRWQDVATAVGYRPGLFSRRLIVTNAWDRGPNAYEALGSPGAAKEPIQWVLRDAFLASEIDWADALTHGLSGEATPERRPRTPRPHQVLAVADTVAILRENPRAQLVMACGSGKTLAALWIAEERKDERVLVLVPSLLLLRQFRRDWIESATLPFVDLVVCSDETTVGRDEVWVRTADLGVAVTTDASEVAAFLRGHGRSVIFATYQSSERIADAQADPSIPAFDLVVCDEAHKLAGVQASGDERERDLKVVLGADRIRASRRLFTTATPRIYGAATEKRLEQGGADIEVASMDDPAVFGPVAHRLTFRSAVEQGILVDDELVVVVVTDAEIADLIDRRAFVRAEELTTDAESLAFLVAVRTAISELDLRRSISFHSSIARARAFARWLPEVSADHPVPATGHVSGLMPTGERNRVVERLRDPGVPTVVTNARCLTEGIDIPALDAVLFVDPRGSHIDIVQAVGRAMRTDPGKECGRVIIPVFLTEAEGVDPEAAVESSAFKPVLDVLRAMRAHDEELSVEATRLRVELGRRGGGFVDSRFLADHIRVLDAASAVDVAAFRRAIRLRAVELSADSWSSGIAALQDYVAREGHARVPRPRGEASALATWVNHQRVRHSAGRLDPARVAELEGLPGWTWDPVADDWVSGVAAVHAFVAREGHSRVPARHVEGDLRLGTWISTQRTGQHSGRLDPTRAAELEAFPGWTWDPRTDDWVAGMAAMRVFVAREGHARVPGDHVEGDLRLGSLLHERRGDRKRARRGDRMRGRLDPAMVAELEALPGWSWDPLADDWTAAVVALRAFVAREGHARVPYGWVEGDLRLGQWVATRRAEHRVGRLEPARAAEVQAFPGWTWDPLSDDWVTALGALRAFILRKGDARVPYGWVEEDLRLGRWVIKRRAEHRVGRLDPDRAAELEALTGWVWEVRPRRRAEKRMGKGT